MSQRGQRELQGLVDESSRYLRNLGLTSSSRTTSQNAEPQVTQRKGANPYWLLFEVVNGVATCPLKPSPTVANAHKHKAVIALGGIDGTSHQNIARHCKKWHPHEFNLLESALKTGKGVANVIETIKSNLKSIEESSGPLDKFLLLREKRPEQADRDVLALLFACENALPFQLFDSKSWHFFCSHENFRVSGADTLMQSRLPALYQMIAQQQMLLLKKAPVVCPIIDGWDAPSGKIIGVCYSFVTYDQSFQKHVITGDLIPTEGDVSQTGELITMLVSSRINTKLLSEEKIPFVVSDSGANYKKVSNTLATHFPCIAHTLQLCLQDAVNKIPTINNILILLRTICRTIDASAPLRLALKEAQEGPEKLALVLPCDTRWNSRYYMLKRALKLKNAISIVLQQEEQLLELKEQVSKDFWNQLKELKIPLKWMKKFTKLVEQDGPSALSTVPRFYSQIFKWLSTHKSSWRFSDKLQQALKTRLGYLVLPGPALMAAALDPAEGDLCFVDEDTRDQVWQMLEKTAIEFKTASPAVIHSILEDVRSTFENFEFHQEQQAQIEMKKCHVSPLEYWNLSPHRIHLEYLICAVYSVPTSSSAVERAFSGTGFIIDGRDSLKLDHLEKIAVIRAAMKSPQWQISDFLATIPTIIN